MEWKDIKGYEGKYQVSDTGLIKSLERTRKSRIKGGKVVVIKVHSRLLKQWKRSNYLLVDLWNDSNRDVRSVHVLVYEAFKGPIKKGLYVHHKDENKLNNAVENLEAVSCEAHNRIHHSGKPSWNKGKKMPPELYKKMWETRRRNKNVRS